MHAYYYNTILGTMELCIYFFSFIVHMTKVRSKIYLCSDNKGTLKPTNWMTFGVTCVNIMLLSNVSLVTVI